jgi:hypothetical protein
MKNEKKKRKKRKTKWVTTNRQPPQRWGSTEQPPLARSRGGLRAATTSRVVV